MEAQFVSKHEIARLIHVSPETLKSYRRSELLVEGIHWIRVNSRVVRYNLPLVQDLFQNLNNPTAHQRTIDNYRATLLSNQRAGRRSKAGGTGV